MICSDSTICNERKLILVHDDAYALREGVTVLMLIQQLTMYIYWTDREDSDDEGDADFKERLDILGERRSLKFFTNVYLHPEHSATNDSTA